MDEKTCIQALERKPLGQPAAPGRDGRREFESVRHGARALFAALEVRTGEVLDPLRKRRTAADLDGVMEALARRYPRGPVYVLWDDFVHTPRHASWSDQVETGFGILQRRIIKYVTSAPPEARGTRRGLPPLRERRPTIR